MEIHQLVSEFLQDTHLSLTLFAPELVLCATVLLILVFRLIPGLRMMGSFWWALVGSGVALALAVQHSQWFAAGLVEPQGMFTDFLAFDSFTAFFRCLLLGFAVLFCILTRITRMVDQEDGPDFYTLVLGATLGMMLMASANHLLMVFLAVEMASVPSYVLAGILKHRRKSSEAALKYSVYGAGAAGVMLYGISLICGIAGSAHLPTIAARLAAMDMPAMIASGEGTEEIGVLALGGLMLMVGLAFKLSAVPFHFWCPDVFEGATAEVNAFLSVASKAAALALLVRVAIGFSDVPQETPLVADPQSETMQVSLVSEARETASDDATSPLAPVRAYIVQLLALIAAITCTFGNLAAYGQTNIKRMLAYSTIAHAGYMMMPVAAAVAALGSQPEAAGEAISSLTFYIVLYLFMNLGAFAVVAFLRNAIGSEEISDYAGLIAACPVTVVCFAALMFSLIGMPPLAGFAGKFAIFASLVEVGGPVMITLLVVAGLNTAISLVYYLRVVKVMTIDPEPDTRGPVDIGFIPGFYIVAVTAPVLLFGILWQDVYRFAARAATNLF